MIQKFSDVGCFFKNDQDIVFLSLAEKVALESFIEQNNFYPFNPVFTDSTVSDNASFLELCDVLEAIPHFQTNINFGSFFSFRKCYAKSEHNAVSSFPAESIAKAILLSEPEKQLIQTERRLSLVDYRYFNPSSKNDVLINETKINPFKTVFPNSFDSWVCLLLKAKSFQTKDPQLLRLKCLFTID